MKICKFMLGKIVNGKHFFSEAEKHEIIQDYLSSGWTKNAIWKKYTGRSKEHGALMRWMRQLGYLKGDNSEEISIASSFSETVKEKKANLLAEQKRLEAENMILKVALEQAELEKKAYQTIIEVAEKELKINIRKK